MHDADPELRGRIPWLPGSRDVPVKSGRYVPIYRDGVPVFTWWPDYDEAGEQRGDQ